jgi:hypothetical protein
MSCFVVNIYQQIFIPNIKSSPQVGGEIEGCNVKDKKADTSSLLDSSEIAGLENELGRRIKNAAGSALKDITQWPMLIAEVSIAMVA